MIDANLFPASRRGDGDAGSTTMIRTSALAFSASFVLTVGHAAVSHGQTIRGEVVASGLTQPLDFQAPPGDTTRAFIVQQTGEIRIFNIVTRAITAGNYINLGPSGLALTTASGERGLLGLAFHPNFSSNGFFYVSYTRSSDGASVIARYTANAPFTTSTSANTASGVVLLTISQPFANHNGGHLAFGPDGMLYVGIGDGGSANDPNELAQNRTSLLGKILRLDVNDTSAADGDGLYIPDNNPYRGVQSPTDFRDEIWAFGLRNPWRFCFDRLTGDLWIADVGQDAREEIDFQPALQLSNPANGNSTILNPSVAGRNYGWDCREGFIATPGTTDVDCSLFGTYTDPIFDVVNAGSVCSISGGCVYRGNDIPSLQGAYFYADYCAGWVRSLRYNGTTVSDQQDWSAQLGSVGSIVGFGEDGRGELYIINIGGSIIKIVPPACGCPCVLTAQDTAFFQDNFQTNTGWTSSISGATSGQWERGVPVNDPAWEYDPISDSDGSGQCYMTQNALGNTDVDGGSVLLFSPALDFVNGGGGAAGGDITICYDYFNYLTVPGEGVDGLFVDVSSNGLAGPWVRVASHTSSNGTAWTPHAITQAQLTAAGVTRTANMRVRFTATDVGTASIVECALDNFRVYRRIPITDCNGNGVADSIDIAMGTSQDCNSNMIPDECDIASGFSEDFDGGPTGVRSSGAMFFGTSCFGCHGATGSGGTGPNIRNQTRTNIRNRLRLIVPHPGGGFPAATDQDFADIEAFLADGGSRARPDRIPDSCQTLPDCDGDGANDGKELQLGTQVDLNYDGLPDACSPCLPVITMDPMNRSVSAGVSVSFSVAATSTDPISYQWRKSLTNLTEGGRFSGVNTATLTINPVEAADAGLYNVRLTNVCGSVVSMDAQLTVNLCVADVDDGSGAGTPDGGVTIEDLLYYLQIFDLGEVAADVDDGSFTGSPDGGVTIEDLLYYLFRFDTGC